ncbi:MAG TPA: toxic anion resistance protein, partial [Aliiroseovarius sp.]|nr:toxic anion resistance protein [Aliiroseovarius sp.]
MAETIREQAQAALKEVEEISAVVLPEPSTELVPVDAADEPTSAEIQKRMDEIDMGNTQSIIEFGSTAQAGLQEISQEMLQGVRNKDVGPAGDSLSAIVTTIRGFSVNELDMRRKRSWWERLLGRAAPAAKFLARYEDVQGQ